MTTALIDADIVCYRASAVADSGMVRWEEDEDPQHLASAPKAKGVADELIESWTKKAKAKRRLLVFSDRTHPDATFRRQVADHYKAQRSSTDRPSLHDAVAKHLRDNYKHVWLPELEGDDTMGLLATGEDGAKYTLVSVDKDMLTLPAYQVNPDATGAARVRVTQHAADYNWMHQTICGDPVDNYKGAPGAGPKRATSVLVGCRTLHAMWEAVLRVFADQRDHPKWGKNFTHDSAFDEALMNARLARILRHGDYDPQTGHVRLWHPEEPVWIDPRRTDATSSD